MQGRYRGPQIETEFANNKKHQLKYLQNLCTFILIALNVSYKTIVNGAII